MRDRDLVRLHWPVELRQAFDALFGIDDALRDVVLSSTQPALGAIRLAWWREALERLDKASPPPEPRLQAAATHILPLGITGEELARLEDGWLAMLDEQLEADRIAEGGAVFFGLAAKLLGANDPNLSAAGRLYGIARANRLIQPVEQPGILGYVAGYRFPRQLRALTSFARLAARDLKADRPEPEATPGRAAAILSHRLFGIVA